MEAIFRQADLTYEANFSVPSFDLPGLGTALLRSLYEHINPLSPINTADMHVLGGSSLSDVRVQVAVFNGHGLIDVRPDGLSINFRGLQDPGHFATCMNCISLSEEATRRTLPDFEVDAVALRPTLFLELDDKTKRASSHLATVTGAVAPLDLEEFGNPAQHPGMNLEIENTEQGWNAIFNAYRDSREEASLIVSCYARYSEHGAIRGLEQRADHLERLLGTLLRGIGLEAPGLSWEAT